MIADWAISGANVGLIWSLRIFGYCANLLHYTFLAVLVIIFSLHYLYIKNEVTIQPKKRKSRRQRDRIRKGKRGQVSNGVIRGEKNRSEEQRSSQLLKVPGRCSRFWSEFDRGQQFDVMSR